MATGRLRSIYWILVSWAGMLPLVSLYCPAQEPPGGPPPDASAPEASNSLDSLLNLAEKDASQLSRVRVAAPALQEEVTTVSRYKSTVGRSPAAVFVITNEMIRRSTARSIPEALRMAPGLTVGKIDANKWSISIRGFDNRYANKLLVQIDGRTVYTPTFGGVYWEVQDVLLEDVERIEIIRGPGATLWGANAVNGIINVITKKSQDTQGVYAEAGGGTEERSFYSARYGGQIGDDAHYRVYGKFFDRDGGYSPVGLAADDWHQGRGGFRLDSQPTCDDTFTVQGDFYQGKSGDLTTYHDLANAPTYRTTSHDDIQVAGGNTLFRWTREVAEDSDWSLQLYYDQTQREYLAHLFREDRDTYDLDYQYRFPLGPWNMVVWGFGYRYTTSDIRNYPPTVSFTPSDRNSDQFTYFIQDQITLSDDLLYLTGGGKFYHGDFSPFEFQPTLRLLLTPDERRSIWASVSQAMRTPTRADQDMTITGASNPATPTVFPRFHGDRAFESEELIAWELGYRAQPIEAFSWDVAMFLHHYDKLQSVSAPTLDFSGFPPFLYTDFRFNNGGSGDTYGLELTANYQVQEWWRLYGAWSLIKFDLSADQSQVSGSSPEHQVYLQSAWDLGRNWEFDAIWRYVDSRPWLGVPSYNTMDLRLAWRPTATFETVFVGRQLLSPRFMEIGDKGAAGTVATEVQREFFSYASWKF